MCYLLFKDILNRQVNTINPANINFDVRNITLHFDNLVFICHLHIKMPFYINRNIYFLIGFNQRIVCLFVCLCFTSLQQRGH